MQATLSSLLSAHCGHDVAVESPVQLSGGASKESWAFDLVDGGQRRPLILRRDPPGGATGRPARDEQAVLDAVRDAGVPVPQVLWSGTAEEWDGATYTVMERIEGETLAPRILRDPAYEQARGVLLQQCARALAGIHSVPVARVVPPLEVRSVEQLVDEVQAMLDAAPNPHPVFELALRWLRVNAPQPSPPALVHADFRMGNLIVGADGLRAVLDWELSHAGDPARDLGYFCVRSWRFGNDGLPAGGLGSREQWLDAYRAAGGRQLDIAAVRYWEVYGTTIWGVQCTMLAQQFLRHGVRSVELAAIGRRAVEMEHDVLALITGVHPSAAVRAALRDAAAASAPTPHGPPGSTQDRPSAAELLSLTADFLHREVMPQLDGRLAFHVRVAGNVLRIVEREVTLAPRLAEAGGDAPPPSSLAARIRSGELDGDRAVVQHLVDATALKLAIANPRHLRLS